MDESAILKELRRRDNLEDFVDGLIRTEVFPYPDGQREIVPTRQVPLQQVKIKPDAYAELTTMHAFGLTFILTPECGVGTYELDGDGLPSGISSEAERLRMALWGRYDWVMEKIDYINILRAEAFEGTGSLDSFLISHNDGTADDNLSEEVDPYDSDDVSSLGSEFSQVSIPIFEPERDSPDDLKFPDAKKLRKIDIQTLEAMFERKELQSLHMAMTAVDTGFKSLTHETSKKRRPTITESDFVSKRSRKESLDGITTSFCSVAQSLPTLEADGAKIRAFREAAGSLHLAARIMELENNLGVMKEERAVSPSLGSPTSSDRLRAAWDAGVNSD